MFVHFISVVSPPIRRRRPQLSVLTRTTTTPRCISSHTARTVLGLSRTEPITSVPQLRRAYLQAAKACHPDVVVNTTTSSEDENNAYGGRRHHDFIRVTKAYEVLRSELTGGGTASSRHRRHDDQNYRDVENDDEYDFRAACQEQLGLSAEIVEECKENPIFRQWLHGNKSHWAQLWRGFLAGHGGWTPQIKTTGGERLVEAGKVPLQRRRRRW